MAITINGNNATVIGTTAHDNISVKGNNDNVYGDFINLSYCYGPNVSLDINGNPIIALNTFTGGDNTLSLNGNNGNLYGSGKDVSLSLTGSNNNAVDFGGASMLDLNFAAGGNTLSASGNNDTLYGAIRDFTINITAGSGNTADFAGIADLDNFSIGLGGNTIIGVNGNNDVVYGAMRNLSLIFSGGNDNASPDLAAGVALTDLFDSSPSSLAVGTNTISVGNGNNDVVYGAMNNLSLIFNSSSNNTGSEANGLANSNFNYLNDTVSVGSNIINVGNGNNDIVFGALQDFTILAMGGNANPDGLFNSANGDENITYTFGGNAIALGNGNNDIVYGALQDFTITLIGGNNNGGEAYNGQAYVSTDTWNVGINTLHVGNGNNDVVYGALQDLSIINTGGNYNYGYYAGVATLEPSTFTIGSNILMIGNGNNDVVYGSLQDLSIVENGGNHNDGSNAGNYAGTAGIGSTSFTGGNNTLIVGNGNNDVVYGDMQSLSISLTGGALNSGGNGAGGAYYVTSSITLGGDTIKLGNGNNDVIFASMDNLSFSTVQGGTSGSGIAAFVNVLGVGDGSISFANTTVMIGNGKNDTVVADDILNLSGLNLFLDASTNPGAENTVQWGNNTITGGTGNDNYVFSLVDDPSGNMAMQGVDILTNFNPAKKDMLSFGYVNDANGDGKITAADLDTSAAFVNIHQGGISGAILGVAAIFNQVGTSAASAFQAAINSFTASDADTGLTLLQDVAHYITDGGLASAVSALQAPEGGLILEGQTTTTMGSFSQINALHALSVEHTAVAVHA